MRELRETFLRDVGEVVAASYYALGRARRIGAWLLGERREWRSLVLPSSADAMVENGARSDPIVTLLHPSQIFDRCTC